MDQALWGLGRGSGVVALVLMTLSVLLGIGTRSGRPILRMPRFSVTLVHRNIALLAVLFVFAHVGSLFFDPYAQLRLIDLVFPFLGAYKPFWLGLGTVAVDLLGVVILTSLLRNRIGPRAFKAVHWLTYGIWPIAVLHAIGNGTDSFSLWFFGLAVTCSLAVAGALCWRLYSNFVEYRAVRLEEK